MGTQRAWLLGGFLGMHSVEPGSGRPTRLPSVPEAPRPHPPLPQGHKVQGAGVQLRLIQGIRRRDGVGEGQETTA